MRHLVLACLLLPIAAQAQTGTETAGPAERIAPDSVIGSVTLDFNDDAAPDRAVLVEAEGGADLYIYLSERPPGTEPRRSLALVKREAAWMGGMWGTQPSLDVSAKGSLLLSSVNDAIGRNRWQQTLTIVYRDGTFIVAGVTYSSRDTLDLSSGSSCDLNLFTGQGTRKGKRITIPAKPVALAEWKSDQLPKECR